MYTLTPSHDCEFQEFLIKWLGLFSFVKGPWIYLATGTTYITVFAASQKMFKFNRELGIPAQNGHI